MESFTRANGRMRYMKTIKKEWIQIKHNAKIVHWKESKMIFVTFFLLCCFSKIFKLLKINFNFLRIFKFRGGGGGGLFRHIKQKQKNSKNIVEAHLKFIKVLKKSQSYLNY